MMTPSRFALLIVCSLFGACATTPGNGPVWPYPEPPESQGGWGYKPPPAEKPNKQPAEPYATPSPNAREQAQPTASRHPGVQALVEQADQERAQGDLDKAASTLERATRIQNNDPLPWLKLAELRFEQGNMIQAENLARRSLSFDKNGPTARPAWLLIADIKRLQGDEPAARSATDNANRR